MQPATSASTGSSPSTTPTSGSGAKPGEAAPGRHETQIKETLISLIIAFALAFVVRAFVIEAFVIPTGSMAPTLMGAHMRFTSANSGYAWPVGPRPSDSRPDATGMNSIPLPIQGGPSNPIIIHDPMTTEELQFTQGVPIRSGDRILVFKYLYSIYEPKRFDVVVFKNPSDPSVNYIKRLIGLPGEQLALIDGDVFARPAVAGEQFPADMDWWALPGWKIQRKTQSERVQRTAWQMVYDSQHAPLGTITTDKGSAFRSPWVALEDESDWTIAQQRTMKYAGSGPTTLAWDSETRPIRDDYPYNETSGPKNMFPVSDVRSMIVLTPGGNTDAGVTAVLRSRRHEFRATIQGTSVTLAMGTLTENASESTPLATIGQGTLDKPLAPGIPATIDFWHVDQSIELRVNDQLVASANYDWSPAERVRFALGLTLDQVMEQDRMSAQSVLTDPTIYSQPTFEWRFAGGPFTLGRAAMWRDLHYQATVANINGGKPRATHPTSTAILSPDHFFVCGDNSPASLDSRLWTKVDPWVAAQIDPTIGVVPRDLMIGKAFFVYFPSLIKNSRSPLPIPDFGRMRFIW